MNVEQKGRFICKDQSCLSLWIPLVIHKGTTPTGALHLGTVRRRGHAQVSYRGLPVYTFAQDSKPGDVKGNGFKDVGVWRPASPGASVSAALPAPIRIRLSRRLRRLANSVDLQRCATFRGWTRVARVRAALTTK